MGPLVLMVMMIKMMFMRFGVCVCVLARNVHNLDLLSLIRLPDTRDSAINQRNEFISIVWRPVPPWCMAHGACVVVVMPSACVRACVAGCPVLKCDTGNPMGSYCCYRGGFVNMTVFFASSVWTVWKHRSSLCPIIIGH